MLCLSSNCMGIKDYQTPSCSTTNWLDYLYTYSVLGHRNCELSFRELIPTCSCRPEFNHWIVVNYKDT